MAGKRKLIDDGTEFQDWTYQGKPFLEAPDPEEFWGFVYLITNIVTDRKYVGRKQFWMRVKWKVKAKHAVDAAGNKKMKTRRGVREMKDWKTYCGSSNELADDVEKYGKDKFAREILHLCEDDSRMNWMEFKEQVIRDVLFDPGYYNGGINVRFSTSQYKNTLVKKFEEGVRWPEI